MFGFLLVRHAGGWVVRTGGGGGGGRGGWGGGGGGCMVLLTQKKFERPKPSFFHPKWKPSLSEINNEMGYKSISFRKPLLASVAFHLNIL